MIEFTIFLLVFNAMSLAYYLTIIFQGSDTHHFLTALTIILNAVAVVLMSSLICKETKQDV